MQTQLIPGHFSDSKTSRVTITPSFEPGKKFKCMHCTLNIETNPIGCPVECVERKIVSDANKHSEEEFSFEFITFGVFCSFNCAKAYVLDRGHDPKFKQSERFLAMMYSHSKFKKISVPITIEPAPSPLLMTCFGGVLSESQYKTQLDVGKFVFEGTTVMYPMSYIFKKN